LIHTKKVRKRYVHYLRSDIQTLCGRGVSKVKSSSSLSDVDCKMCINSLPVEIIGSDDIIKILKDNGYELDGTEPMFIKMIDNKLFIRKSRWMNWDKVNDKK
jgi:hypothetical protein